MGGVSSMPLSSFILDFSFNFNFAKPLSYFENIGRYINDCVVV